MENVPWSELGKQNIKAEKVYNSSVLRMEVNRKLISTVKINQLSYKSTQYPRDLRNPLAAIVFLHIFVFGLEIFFPVTARSLFGPFKGNLHFKKKITLNHRK